MKKALPVGVDNYKDIIDRNYYYVDKTMMIKDILDKEGAVNLFTKPRRFGKTLVLNHLDKRDLLYISEFNYTKNFAKMDTGCEEALQQIEERNYAEKFLNEGYLNIRKFRICFCKRTVG